MPRKTTILIVILAAITGILIFLAVRNDTAREIVNNATDTVQPTATPAPQPYATVAFAEDILDLSLVSATQTVDIVIDTASKPVAGAQIELSYDPRILTNVRILPAPQPFFGPNATVLINSVDQVQGRISYAAHIPSDDEEKIGNGTVVRIGFTANKSAGVSTTQFSFLSKSAVTSLDTQNSVLQNTRPLQVILTATTPIEN